MRNFELQFWHVGGCGGYPLSSKSILKVKKQNPLPKEHVHIMFLTPRIVFVGMLGFQSLSKHYERHCTSRNSNILMLKINLVNVPHKKSMKLHANEN